MVFVTDRIKAMQEQEESSYKTQDYVSLLVRSSTLDQEKDCPDSPDSPLPSPESLKKWREVICEWAYNVVDLTDRPREMVAVCLNFLDRTVYQYLLQNPSSDTSSKISKSDYQLFSLTCLYLASKVYDAAPGSSSLTMEEVIALGRRCFTREQIEQTERYVLNKTLHWQLQPPTAHVFLKYYILLLGLSLRDHKCLNVFEHANFLVEVSVMEYAFCTQKTSHIALAALLNAFERERDFTLTPYQWRLLMNTTTTTTPVRECQALLHLTCENIELEDAEEQAQAIRGMEQQGYSRATSPVSILEDTMF